MKQFFQLTALLLSLLYSTVAPAVINAVGGGQQGYSDGQGGTMIDAPVSPSWSGSEDCADATVGGSCSCDVSSFVSGNYTPVCDTTPASGSFPAGCTLASDCTFSGTYSNADSYSYTIQASNGAGSSTSATIAQTINYSAGAADYYVSTSGSDSNDGSSGSPWLTPNYAYSQAVGGDIVEFAAGTYPALTDSPSATVFSSEVTFRAATGETVVFDGMSITANTTIKTINLTVDGIDFTDSVLCEYCDSVTIKNASVTTDAPISGSDAALGVRAVKFSDCSNMLADTLDISHSAIGFVFDFCDTCTLTNSTIHDLGHDGIRVVSSQDILVSYNHVYGVNDGATDAEETWSIHADTLQFIVSGSLVGGNYIPNDGVIIYGNIFHDAESQLMQFNNYSGTAPEHNSNILIEQNIFGPAVNPYTVNNADPVDNLVVRNNIFVGYSSTYTSATGVGITDTNVSSSNARLRTDADTSVNHIYNNIFYTTPSIEDHQSNGVEIYDYNVYFNPDSDTALSGHNTVDTITNVLGSTPDLLTSTTLNYSTTYNGYAYDPSAPAGASPIIGPTLPTVPTLNLGANTVSQYVAAAISAANTNKPTRGVDTSVVVIKDDFEDGTFLGCDASLYTGTQDCIEWSVYPTSGSPSTWWVNWDIDNSASNSLRTPQITDTYINMLLAENTMQWDSYTYEFSANNTLASQDTGVVFDYMDDNNYYLLDVGTSRGRLVRVLAGVSTTLISDNASLRASSSTFSDFKITVSRVASTSVDIAIDVGNNGSDDFTYSDTDSGAVAEFTTGGIIGIYFGLELSNNWRSNFDDIIVTNTE